MNLHVIGSSSKGNSYVLSNGSETLVIEAGARYKQVKQVIDYKVDTVQALLVTHSHSDHAAYLSDYLMEGVKVLSPPGVASKMADLAFTSIGFWLIGEPGVEMRFGNFHVLPFYVVHDVPCFGYLIHHPECGKLVYITDTHYSPFKFNDINHWIIEANYDADILQARYESGKINYSYYDRVLHSHMSLQTTMDILRINDLSKTQSIILIHLSDQNSDEKMFIEEVTKAFGVPTYVADAGRIFNLSAF